VTAQTEPRPPRDSATVLLLRDEPRGLEVFMVRRHLNSDFVGGAYVFPGGGLDPADLDPGLQARASGLDAEAAGRRLGLSPDLALAHWIAAIRETFEEAGVLLATLHGAPVALDADPTRWADRRATLLAARTGFAKLVADEDLTLACDRLAYFAHWVTPEGTPKRFSTRFYAAIVPAAQDATADMQEVEAGIWVRPQDALDARARGELTMIFPTVKTLEELATYEAAADVLAACEGRAVVTQLPRVVTVDGAPCVLLPGYPGYAEAEGQPPPAFDPSRM
jgi:8-oxo-dGTP pyrophosphatase MutT (NUDIX family)